MDKCKALASELLRQTRSTPHQGQSLPLPPNVAVVQDANDYVNGHAWGVYIKQKKLEIAYGVDVSCALERQYMRFNQLGSAEKDQSPLRYAPCHDPVCMHMHVLLDMRPAYVVSGQAVVMHSWFLTAVCIGLLWA